MTIPDLDAVLLAAVAQLAPNAYGVAIRSRAGELLGRVPSVGTVYSGLAKLERAGMIRARAGEPTPVRGGRAKRFVTLTAVGVRALERARREAERRVALLAPVRSRA